MNKTVLITGASAGIGEETARIFAKNGYNLILFARRIDKLKELAEILIKEYAIKIYTAKVDVCISDEVKNAILELPNEFRNISILVNNAGLAAGLSDLEHGSIDNWDRMIDTNVKGMLYLTKYCIPLLKQIKYSHIINIGSIAAKDIYQNGNVYCASKHAVDALTKSMRLELSSYPIKVTGIHPGAVETEFSLVRFDGDGAKAKSVYEGFENLVASDIAEAIFWCVTRPKHVNINELTIMPTAQPKAGIIHKNLAE